MVEEFKSLLRETSGGYIGHGNPNAKILFLGQEPNWDTEDPEQKAQYQIEIKNNSEDWKQIVLRGDDYGLIDSYVANFNLKKQKPEFYSPLNPWPLQKYQVLTWKTIVEKAPSGFSGRKTFCV